MLSYKGPIEVSGSTSSPRSVDTASLQRKRPYASACIGCKARKIRCDDPHNPPCKACRAAGITCEQSSRNGKRAPRSVKLADGPEGERRSSSTKPRGDMVEERLSRIEKMLNLAPIESRAQTEEVDEEEQEMAPPRFQLELTDHPVYHGETSMYDDARPSLNNSPATRSAPPPSAKTIDVSTWSEQDIRRMTRLRHVHINPDEGEVLMDAYFCWASPTYAVVNREIFLRDMAVQGPYFSEILLLAMYISGLRFSPGLDPKERQSRSQRYHDMFMSHLTEELCKPSSITTTQALLSLAGRQIAVGEQTQSWLFTGLAIRMIRDLGIHLAIDDPSLDAQLPQEDRDMRVRLYWAAYCWDKTISVGMGREPALTCRPDTIPEVKINESDDVWQWRPYFPGGLNAELVDRYPPVKLRTNWGLRYFSELNMVVESMLVNMYSPHRPNARSTSFIYATDDRLREWRKDLPDELKIDVSNPPEFCPPISVTVLNLLFHVIKIFLYRPLLSVRSQSSAVSPSSFQICRTAAVDIHAILSLWGKTYGVYNLVYQMMFTTYVAAGVDVIILRLGAPQMKAEAFNRIQLSLAILEQASAQGPGIRKGIAIISAQLEAATARMTEIVNNPTIHTDNLKNLKHAESSLRSEPQVTPSSSSWKTNISPLLLGNQPMSINNQFVLDVPTSSLNSEASFTTFFDDAENQKFIADLLGESNVDTNDPFAFLTSEGWEDFRY